MYYIRLSTIFFTVCGLFSLSFLSHAEVTGAKIFSDRCVLCHGSQGMGEGPLPMSLKNYPSANLLRNINKQSRNDIQYIISNGSEHTPYMPPWKGELSEEEISAVTEFIILLRSNIENALSLLNKVEQKKIKHITDGKKIYETRCVLCHGTSGLGDGRMSRVVNNPPPFNLTKSVMPPDYLKAIIKKGGEAMSRSKQMPPWGDQLNDQEINSVVEYILTFRK